ERETCQIINPQHLKRLKSQGNPLRLIFRSERNPLPISRSAYNLFMGINKTIWRPHTKLHRSKTFVEKEANQTKAPAERHIIYEEVGWPWNPIDRNSFEFPITK